MNKPQAFIAVNKNRLKHYGDTVYLKDNTDFQIEFNNPTSDRYLAKITHQGRQESSGLILRPGEHVYIDRFLDEGSKLTFDTYSVPGENLEAAEKQNGKIKITFHKERPPRPNLYRNDDLLDNLRRIQNDKINPDPKPQPWKWDGDTGGMAYYNSDGSSISVGGGSPKLTSNYCHVESQDNVTLTSSLSKQVEQETGRIEKGEESDQKFDRGEGDFSPYTLKTVTLIIRPESRKPQTAPIRKYCSDCGSKVKKKWKYCTVCGEKI